MKKQREILILIFLGILYFTLICCNEKEAEKQSQLIYFDGTKRIELIFESGVEYLIMDQPTKAKFLTENIDNQHFLIVGPGISRNSDYKSEYRWIITAPKNSLTDGKLKISATEIIAIDENLNAEFLVDVKTAE